VTCHAPKSGKGRAVPLIDQAGCESRQLLRGSRPRHAVPERGWTPDCDRRP